MPYGSWAAKTLPRPRPHNSGAESSDKVQSSRLRRASSPLPPRSSVLPEFGSPTSGERWTERTAPTSKRRARESGADEGREPRRRRPQGRMYAPRPSTENVVREFCERLAFQGCAGCGAKSPVPRAARFRLVRGGKCREASWPLQQEHFRRESRPEGHHESIASRRHFFLHQPLVQNEQNAGARKIAVTAQDVPGNFSVGAVQAQLRLHVGQQFLSAGMQEKRGNIVAAQTLAREKTFGQLFDFFADNFRHILR